MHTQRRQRISALFVLFLLISANFFFVQVVSAQFDRTLTLGDRGEDVALLQKFLNAVGKTLASAPEPGSPGHETDYYGVFTASAVRSLQCDYAIVCAGTTETTGWGIVGQQTRRILNSIFQTVAHLFATVPPRTVLSALEGAGSNLAAYWTFDEGGGTVAADSSGNGNSGTLMNGPTWTTGKVGSGALSLDGTDDYVEVGDSASLSPTSAVAVSFWIKANAYQGSKTIIRKGIDDADTNYGFITLPGTTPSLAFGIRDNTQTSDVVGGDFNFTNNAWHHVVGTFDGDMLRLYLNGTAAFTKDTALTNIRDTAGVLRLGSGMSGGNYAAVIDDVRIYSRALSAAEVSELYNYTGSTPPPPADTTPPLRSAGAPSGSLPAGTTSTTLSLTTDENATCRYSTTANTAWSSMTNTFSTTGNTSHSTTVSGLMNGQSYTYYVRCQDAAGNANSDDFSVGFSVSSPADSTPPSAPTGLIANALSPSQINLSWNASTDNVSVVGYRVYRNSLEIATSNTTSYSDSGLTPSTLYTYTIAALDAQGNLSTLSAPVQATTLSSTATPSPSTGSWQPPIGIPRPSFGIEEQVSMYKLNTGETCATHANKCYNFGSGLQSYKLNSSGDPYTHYIDKSSASCSDTNNAYGDRAKPRCNVPDLATLDAGTVLELHGGPYTNTMYLTSNGTASRPIFFRGAAKTDRPIVQSSVFMIRAHYIIVENIDFDRNQQAYGAVDIRPWFPYESVHHVSVRGSEVRNALKGVGGNSSMMFAGNFESGNDVYDVVFYDNNIHPDDSDITPFDAYEKDTDGIGFGSYSHRVWIVDNDIHHAAGDAVGGGHGVQYTATDYYVGRNRLHDTGENAFDVKEVENVVVSQNVMYNFAGQSAGSDGTATVVHYGPTFSSKNVWFLFNEIHHASDVAIQVGGSQEYPVYYIGNIVHDIQNVQGTARALSSWGSRDIHLIGNTFYRIDNGLNISGNGNLGKLSAHNNIFGEFGSNGYALWLDDSTYRTAADLKNNLFYEPGGSTTFQWGSTYNSLTAFQSATGKCTGCIETDPKFTNAAANDFRLQSSSPAIDTGILSSLYQQFQTTFGVPIQIDFTNISRPQGAAWDIGAYEYTSPTPPPADTTVPTISSITASSITTTGTTINWTTNEASDSRVEYGLTTSYGSSVSDSTLVSAHSQVLASLSPATLYHYRVSSRDAAGNLATSGDMTVTTQTAADTTVPTVFLSAPTGGASVSGSSVTVGATASDNVGVAGVQFKLVAANLGGEDTLAPYQVMWDTTTVPNASYTLLAVARDTSGNRATSTSITVTVNNVVVTDTTAPVRSGGSPSGTLPINTTSATLSLSTDEAATCRYGTASGVTYNLQPTTFTTTGGTTHSVSVSGLSNGAAYTYYIRCQDGAFNANTTDWSISFTVASVPLNVTLGAPVQVTSTVNVRAAPSTTGILLGTVSPGTRGSITDGPVSANGFVWWKVRYQSTLEGWSIEAPLSALPDTDGDYIADDQDLCPATPLILATSTNQGGCPQPLASFFDIKPDFNQDLRVLTSFWLGKSTFGTILFATTTSTYTLLHDTGTYMERLNLDANITIERNKISLNPQALLELNRPATLTLYGVSVSTPTILKDGAPCTTCTVISYSNGTLVFTVNGFSTYEVIEGASSPGSSPSTSAPSSSGGGGGGYAPVTITASSSRSVILPAFLSLSASVQGTVASVSWSVLSGPGTVTFSDRSQASTTASFSEVGTYVLRFTAFGPINNASRDVTVTATLSSSAPPKRSQGAPLGVVSGTSVVLSLKTDVPSQCFFSSIPNEMLYSMTHFENSLSTVHRNTIKLDRTGTYRYFVKCRTVSALIPNATDYPIFFSVSPVSPPERDVNVPHVALVPLEPSTRAEGTTTIEAIGADDIGLSSLTLLLNDKVIARSASSTRVVASWYALSGTSIIVAVGKDHAGNTATSSPLILTVTAPERNAAPPKVISSLPPVTSPVPPRSVSSPPYRFARPLGLGAQGEDVKQLQLFLNSKGFVIRVSGPGSPGEETTYFGPATKAALVTFQEVYARDILTPYGLQQGTGFFGTTTIQKINALVVSSASSTDAAVPHVRAPVPVEDRVLSSPAVPASSTAPTLPTNAVLSKEEREILGSKLTELLLRLEQLRHAVGQLRRQEGR